MRLMLPILLCAPVPAALACSGDEPVQIIEVWSQTFAAEPAPPGIGPERRVLVALSGTMGELTTHEQQSGAKLEGPHPTFPTARAPVASDFTVFLVSTLGSVVGLEIGSGRQVAQSTALGVPSPLVVAPDGSLRVGSTRLFAMRPDGSTMYDVPVGGPIASAPAVAADGTTYAAVFTPGRLIGVSTNGDTVFDRDIGESAGGVSVSGERVAVGHNAGVTVFQCSGEGSWSRPRQARVSGTRFVNDGRLLVWGEDGLVELLDDELNLVWTFDAGLPIESEVVVIDSRVGVFDLGGTVHLLELSSGERLTTHALGGAPSLQIPEGELTFVYVAVGNRIVALDFFVGE